jgi:phosphoserine phosphatase
VAAQPELCERQPWKAVAERDFGWFGALMAEHYAGDDTNVRKLLGGILAAYEGISVEDFEAQSDAFMRSAQHPTLGRGYLECGYAPMVELLNYLKANGFSNYIASGGGRDFMRPISQDMYGIPRERVIGSSSTFAYTSDEHGGTITHKPEADCLVDGPEKPVRIWNRTGRRPLLAAGNSNGDVAMLEFTHHPDHPTLRLVVLHDDAEREFDYTTGAEQALKQADANGWTVISTRTTGPPSSDPPPSLGQAGICMPPGFAQAQRASGRRPSAVGRQQQLLSSSPIVWGGQAPALAM